MDSRVFAMACSCAGTMILRRMWEGPFWVRRLALLGPVGQCAPAHSVHPFAPRKYGSHGDFGRGGGLPGGKQTVLRSEVYAGIQPLRIAPRKTPLILVSDNEYFVSTAQKGRANPVGPCSDLWHQYWVAAEYLSAAILVMKVKSRASEWTLWSGHQHLWMYAGSELADRQAAKGGEATLQKIP